VRVSSTALAPEAPRENEIAMSARTKRALLMLKILQGRAKKWVVRDSNPRPGD
jgi:hypothetical protein